MYKCLAKERYEDGSGYALVPLREQDIEAIRCWRNAQMDILRQQHVISPEEQKAYYTHTIQPLFQMEHPRQILFSFLKEDHCIGYGGLTYIDWISKRAEVSFLVDVERAGHSKLYQEGFLHFLELLKKVAFVDLKFHRLFAETFAFRTEHMRILEFAGFKLEGRLREHVFKQDKWVDSFFHGILQYEL